MSITFYELTELLASSEIGEERELLSRETGEFLNEDPDLSKVLVTTLINSVVFEANELDEIVKSDFFKVTQAVYLDDDGLTKIAIGLAFLQDYRDFDPDLEKKVIEIISNELKSRGLDLLCNDITVNSLQVRDHSIGSLL